MEIAGSLLNSNAKEVSQVDVSNAEIDRPQSPLQVRMVLTALHESADKGAKTEYDCRHDNESNSQEETNDQAKIVAAGLILGTAHVASQYKSGEETYGVVGPQTPAKEEDVTKIKQKGSVMVALSPKNSEAE